MVVCKRSPQIGLNLRRFYCPLQFDKIEENHLYFNDLRHILVNLRFGASVLLGIR